MQKHLILCLEAVERTIPPKIHRLDWIPQPVPFAVCVWFGSLSFSHMEHDLQIILQRSGSKKETVFFLCPFNSYNSLLLFMLCESFLLLSQVSVESKGSCMIQGSILFLCFSKVFPKVGSKRFNCRILQGCDSQANVYFTHTSRFGLTFCTFPYCLCLKLTDIQFHCLKEDFF